MLTWNEKLKILVVTCDPSERAFSDFMHSKGNETENKYYLNYYNINY